MSSSIKIVQLIDSLEPGGAEKMAVNYANSLAKKNAFSGLIATRKEGMLKQQLSDEVTYLFLNKKNNFDLKALKLFRDYLVKYKVNYIHAHSSSFFWAVLVKISLPKIKVIWHDHYGNSEFLSNRNSFFLKLASFLFHAVIAVNQNLLFWAKTKLYCKNVVYLPNFSVLSSIKPSQRTILEGELGKKIVCLANLRPQKNHYFLIQIAIKIKEKHPNWTFHLVGKDFEDEYSKKIKEQVQLNGLEKTVFIYGAKNDISQILEQSTIGILTSQSEGLPVALIEYGFHKLPVVSTDVGQIRSVIENDLEGFVVPSNNLEGFVSSLEVLINDSNLMVEMGDTLKNKVVKEFSETAVLQKYLTILD